MTSISSVQFSSVQSLSCVRLFPTPWTGALRPPCPLPTPRACSNSCPLSWCCHPNHLILRYPLLLLSSVFPRIRVFSNESVLCIRWPKYWSFNISPSNEYSGLISFRVDWLDLLAVQGTLKSLLQFHGSKASIRQHSAFFIIQLSHPYMTTGKTIALTRGIFVSNWMPLTSIARTQNTCSFCLSLLDHAPWGKPVTTKEIQLLWAWCAVRKPELAIYRGPVKKGSWLTIPQLLQPLQLRCQISEKRRYFGHPVKSSPHMIPASAAMWLKLHEGPPFEWYLLSWGVWTHKTMRDNNMLLF